MINFKQQLNYLIELGINESDSDEEKLKKRIFVIIPMTVGVIGTLWGSTLMALGHYLSGSIPLTYTVIAVICLLHYFKTKTVTILQYSQLISLMLLPFLTMWSMGGYASGAYMMIWAFFSPMAAIVYANKKTPFWFISFIILVSVSSLTDSYFATHSFILPQIAIDIFTYMNIVAGFSLIYLVMRRHIAEKDALAEEKQLKHLELLQKSEELRILNANLQTLIDQEVEKNRQKDSMLQQQARHAAMGEMIGNIAHQWRQPLGVIASITTNFMTQIELELDIPSTILMEKYKEINTNVNYLSKTIDDFRNFLKDSQAKTTFDIASVVTNALNLSKPDYDSNYIQIDMHATNEMHYYGASSMLLQVILNLLSNAKDALIQNEIEDKKVRISLEETSDLFIIKVKDNGGGVSDELKEKIFDPYFTTKHQSKGTGLGLYMSSQIIMNHFHGHLNLINVEDEDGMGACFVIEFPKSEETTA